MELELSDLRFRLAKLGFERFGEGSVRADGGRKGVRLERELSER